MKRVVISVIVIIFGFFLIFFGVLTLQNSQKLMMQELDSSNLYLENNNENLAVKHFENAKRHWDKNTILSSAILGNGTVNEIQMALVETDAIIKIKGGKDAILRIRVLKEQINSIFVFEHASFQNMF